ncbi:MULTISPECIES: hypothetical protein [Sinorhizobium]|uniref:hypothetical protein n=1 Tax=Sinorhizobium TaxID=28105 RepID=UPI00036BBF99|nr:MULTISPECIES: hypothetical protein [Sinorhizobium]WOS67123.1 hypothetical protein SFGR64A_30525 [Sinorhizobium fredii GR64]
MADSRDLELFRQRIAEALPSANIPTLLLLLYQFTGQVLAENAVYSREEPLG